LRKDRSGRETEDEGKSKRLEPDTASSNACLLFTASVTASTTVLFVVAEVDTCFATGGKVDTLAYASSAPASLIFAAAMEARPTVLMTSFQLDASRSRAGSRAKSLVGAGTMTTWKGLSRTSLSTLFMEGAIVVVEGRGSF